MDRLTRVTGYAFLVLVATAIPVTAWPPTVSDDITVTYYGAKALVAFVSVIVGWIALLSHLRSESLAVVGREVFATGSGKWLTLFIAATLLTAFASDVGLATAMLGSARRLDGALIVALIYHLAQLAMALARQGVLSPDSVMAWTGVGAVAVAGWIGAEAAGHYPWSLVFTGLSAGPVAVGPIGHPSVVTIYAAVVYVVLVIGAGRARGIVAATGWGAAVVLGLVIGLHVGRAGVLAAIIALGLLASILILRRDRRWISAISGVALLGACVLAVNAVSSWSVEQSDRLTRLATDAQSDNSLQLRFITWRLGARSVLDAPLLGTGTGSFADRVWDYASDEQERALMQAVVPAEVAAIARRDGRYVSWYDAELQALRIWEIDYDKAHNYFLDIAIHAGLVAMGAALAFWVSLTAAAARLVGRRPEALAGIVAYLVALQTWFINVNIDPPLLVLLVVLSTPQAATRTLVPAGGPEG